jgi:peptide/nickel transport system permease protein
MTRFFLRRTFSSLVALFIFLTLFFFAAQLLMPGDYFSQFLVPGAVRDNLREGVGLDRPIIAQYIAWLSNLAQGNLGDSFSGNPVTGVIWNVLPTSMMVFLTGGSLGFLLGFWLGKLTGWSRNRAFVDTVTFGGITLYTMFPPWLAFLTAWIFAAQFKVFRLTPTIEMMREGLWFELGRNVIEARMLLMMVITLSVLIAASVIVRLKLKRALPPVLYVILPPVVALVGAGWWGFGPEARELFLVAGLPIMVFALLSMGEVLVIMQTTLRETLHEDYTLTARAKGLKEGRIRDRHGVPNAILPVISRSVISIPYLLAGLVIIEFSLELQGLGGLLFLAMMRQDFPVVMGILLMTGAFTVVAQIIVDFVQAVIDPRIRYGTHAR